MRQSSSSSPSPLRLSGASKFTSDLVFDIEYLDFVSPCHLWSARKTAIDNVLEFHLVSPNEKEYIFLDHPEPLDISFLSEPAPALFPGLSPNAAVLPVPHSPF